MAEKENIYIVAKQNAEVMDSQVCVKDIASVYCRDRNLHNQINVLKICRIREQDQGRKVVSILKVIEEIEKAYPAVKVESLGETAVLIEKVRVGKKWGAGEYIKLLFVFLVSFFGTGFTIMAFHNDIGIHQMFTAIHAYVMGYSTEGFGVLEVSYSFGLVIGILVFFNHAGGRRLTRDPTPIEVEMRIYERDVNSALIETADREGKTIESD